MSPGMAGAQYTHEQLDRLLKEDVVS
jgi:hypothetical protein